MQLTLNRFSIVSAYGCQGILVFLFKDMFTWEGLAHLKLKSKFFVKNLCNQFSVYMDVELAWWAEISFDAWRDLGNGMAKTDQFLLSK